MADLPQKAAINYKQILVDLIASEKGFVLLFFVFNLGVWGQTADT